MFTKTAHQARAKRLTKSFKANTIHPLPYYAIRMTQPASQVPFISSPPPRSKQKKTHFFVPAGRNGRNLRHCRGEDVDGVDLDERDDDDDDDEEEERVETARCKPFTIFSC